MLLSKIYAAQASSWHASISKSIKRGLCTRTIDIVRTESHCSAENGQNYQQPGKSIRLLAFIHRLNQTPSLPPFQKSINHQVPQIIPPIRFKPSDQVSKQSGIETKPRSKGRNKSLCPQSQATDPDFHAHDSTWPTSEKREPAHNRHKQEKKACDRRCRIPYSGGSR